MLVGDVLESKPKDVFDEVINNFEDAACFALQILARIYSSTERAAKANEADRRALKLNPLLWKSFEGLCQRGDYPDPSKVFATDKLDCLSQCQGLNPILSYVNKASSPPSANYAASSLPQPRVSLLATPTYSYGGASTSTPILPVSSLHVLSNGPQQAMSQSIMMVTPVHQSVANSIEESGCDSVFSSASPVPESFRCFAISGVGALDLSSDLDQSNITAPFFESQQKMMPPPPIKPKPTRRIAPSAMAQNDSRNMTPPTTEFRGGTNDRSFGRLPRGALVWSSNGKSEQTGVNPNLQGARLDFSPLTALSPFSPNPSTPVQQSAVGSSVAGDQSSSSAVPLINTTNNDTKIKRSQIENSSPLKQAPFGQTVQNTPSNNSGSGSVRRSSRLGSSQQLSIKSKENTKTPSTPTVSSKTSRAMKSPSKKTSKATRLNSKTGPNQASTDASSQLAEKNEKNKLLDLDVENIPRITLQNPEVSAIVTDQALSLQKQSMDGLMFLMRQLGAAYVDLSRFASRKAIAQLENLAPHHRNTGWVKGIMGMAYFEMGDYRETKKLFQSMRDLDPYRTEFMEYFSTTLWHLQEEVDLSALAQELTAFDKMSPQAWCAAGNCFSLQKEHENAIKFFQRAAQVNPSFAYAYTLLGHEYITIEELDKALSCFRTAVRIDPRHYNAWYGIGLVFYKQERFQLAEIYYRKAVEINPQSPVLMCHVAVVIHTTALFISDQFYLPRSFSGPTRSTKNRKGSRDVERSVEGRAKEPTM
jgi:tetratricopeptide (TPR) repeat protein